MVATSWHQAAAYCNWLSKQENLPECYELDAKGQVLRVKVDGLNSAGYRLPTEAEIECATRAGATTSRHFGETEELLPKYAWFLKNSQERTQPVGKLKPNDLGLFDVHGNVYTWCQESYQPYTPGINEDQLESKEDALNIVPTKSRLLRGGAFVSLASVVRSAYRYDDMPTYRGVSIGFRLARTFPLQ